jgi:hypothetical protein
VLELRSSRAAEMMGIKVLTSYADNKAVVEKTT